MSEKKYVIGLDFGTDSARAVIVDATKGIELASSVKYYPRWVEGKYCDPASNQYRQHPLDYLEVTEFIIKDALSKCNSDVAEGVAAISVDTTGSTPVLVNDEGTPLSMIPEFKENPNAMFVLWKDHTAIDEAEKINQLCATTKPDYLKYVGGIYSSEWVWAKVWHILKMDEKVKKAAHSWIEHCDWIPAVLTGNEKPEKVIRSRCAAGHKALWSDEWRGLPPATFFNELDPVLVSVRNHLYIETYTSDKKVGNLTGKWAKTLGLGEDVAVGVGAFDCHMGAVGGELKPHMLARTIGTSTCDIMIAHYDEIGDKTIKGICGQVDGSVIPGYVGLEAGQSAFGDVYAWLKNVVAWPLENILKQSNVVSENVLQEILDQIIPALSQDAAKLPVNENSLVATDWLNGRRTPDADQKLKGTITGLTLGTTAPAIFKALVEATAFGSKAIVDRFDEEGVRINEIIALGGVAKKSPFVMQTLANVLNMPIKVATTEQTCAFGAAMFASVVGGINKDVQEAQKRMGQGFDKEYLPDADKVGVYQKIYLKYEKLGKFTEENLFI